LIFYDFGMMGRYVRCSLWLVQTCSNKNSPVAHILSFMVRFGFTNMIGITSCSISPNIREGLLETFYGVYEKDPDKVDAFNRPCSIMLWIFYYNIPFLNTHKCLKLANSYQMKPVYWC
jgi:hypothetical protein